MRLRYDPTIPAAPGPVVMLGPTGQRVEMHIREDEDGTATLVALSGPDSYTPPKGICQQGPYHLRDQAVAARRAIAAQLKHAGFRYAQDEYPRWYLAVQRSINDARKIRGESAGNYRFDPKDVFLDW